MAQTGYTPILIYSSSTVSQAPSAGNLTNSTLGSELAINITDGKLFYKDNANAVQVIAWKTTPTTAGGTGLTSYTAGDLLYYATGTTLTKLSIGSAYQALQVNAGGTAPSWQASATSTLTAQGDLLYASAANTLARLAKNTTSTRYLSNTGSSNNPAWAQVDLTNGVTGTLPVGNGGTGTATAFTAGSVVFAGASGVFSQDNANFFWDDTNNRLGIGTTSPTGRLEMVALAADAEAYGTIYSATGGNEFSYLLRKSNQNTVGNTATVSGDRLGALYWQGNSGSGFTPAARIRSVQVGAASTQTPAEIKFETSNGTSFAEKLNIAPGGDVTVNVGNLVIGTSGKGIDFSATAGTGTSELLDDYEEGTWTAVISDGTNNATMVANTQSYTKVGRLVTLAGYLQTSSLGSVTGNIRITGIPFTPDFHAGATAGVGLNLNITANQSVGLGMDANVGYILLYLWDAAAGSTNMQATEWSSDGFIIFTLSYTTAS